MKDHRWLRKTFVEFFTGKNHKLVPSLSVLPPAEDHSLLFVNSGMVQFKKYFLHNDLIEDKSVISIQKCIRAGGKHNDIEEVGPSPRHHTFFEMLGNFSFGSYGKDKAINLVWEFLTEVLQISKSKLIVSVHPEDQESYDIWTKLVNKEKIVQTKDNFWRMADNGPCGYCSEIYINTTGEPGFAEDFNEKNYLELWNIVFMQFHETAGEIKPLEKICIDTGGGLERLLSVLQSKTNNFDTDVFSPIIDKLIPVIHEDYVRRIIADHTRTACIAISDGVIPGKDGKEFVLRKIIRRAVKYYSHYRKEPIMYLLVPTIQEIFQGIYNVNVPLVEKLLKKEEEQYLKILSTSDHWVEKILKTKKSISGEDVFFLYDTHGIPAEISWDILESKSITLSSEEKDKFNELMEKQRSHGIHIPFFDFKFLGYSTLKTTTQVVALLDSHHQRVNLLNSTGFLITRETPFYGESGGQIGDTGVARGTNFMLRITNTKKLSVGFGEIHIHSIEVKEGIIWEQDEIIMEVDKKRRSSITRHHSAIHIIGGCIERLKGTCEQKGSLVTENYARIDVEVDNLSHEDIASLENDANAIIDDEVESQILELSMAEAEKLGIKKLPGVSYPEKVRVINFPGFSTELCCGTHVNNTSQIGPIMIKKISSIGAGIKRVEILCGIKPMEYLRSILSEMGNLLHCPISDLLEKVKSLPQNKKKKVLQEKEIIHLAHNSVLAVYQGEEEKNISTIVESLWKNHANVFLVNITTGTILFKSNHAKKIWELLKSKIVGGGNNQFYRGRIQEDPEIFVSYLQENINHFLD